MRLVMVTGSRSLNELLHRQIVRDRLDELDGDVIVLHGAASHGADRFAASWAVMRSRPSFVYPANWNAHGKAAGFSRNQAMVDLGPELVLAFWDGESRGTKDAMDRAIAAGIPVEVAA